MQDWEKKLRSELGIKLEPEFPHQERKIGRMKTKKRNSITDILAVAVVCVTIVNVALIYYKFSNIKTLPIANVPTIINSDSKLEERLKKVEQRQNSHGEKIWLLAVANNENTNINKMIHPQQANKYLYLNEQWKINKLPETLEMSPEEKDVFNRYIAK